MSSSGRKDFDVKHILRLRWKLFSHPATPSGGCLQQDSSFEHWGPSQSRLLKSQERSGGAFWKRASSSSSSPPAAAARLHALPEQPRQQPAPRTVFYVESLDGEFTREPEKALLLRQVKEEPAPFLDAGGQATGEAAAHRLSAASHPMTPQCDMDSSSSEEYYQAVHHAEQTFRKMESYLKQQQLCDVILIAGNRKIPAHRQLSNR